MEKTNSSSPDRGSLFFGQVLPENRPSVSTHEDVEVTINVSTMIDDYVRGFISETHRRAPIIANSVDLTLQQLLDYVKYLYAKRIEIINLDCRDVRKLQVLWIPTFIQFLLSAVGKVEYRKFGITISPKLEVDGDIIDFDYALEISNKIGMFRDVLHMETNAIPKGIEGDSDVMSFALIQSHLRTFSTQASAAGSYAAAYLGIKLKEQCALAALYRIEYDEYSMVKQVMKGHHGLYK